MIHAFDGLHRKKENWLPFLVKIESIFSTMDSAYKKTADAYGFNCRGCEDSCCLTRFYHYTVIEYLYLMKGVNGLDPGTRATVFETAKAVCRKMDAADQSGETVRIMCPLNENNMCLAYEHRPMICRLHGIPHQFQRTGVAIMKGPGCKAFDDRCGHMPYRMFDRTPFYTEMALLEKALRQALGFEDKIKMTIAQMLVVQENHTDETR